MIRLKEKLLENDFGAYLYDLRMRNEYTIEELIEKLNIETIKSKNIRKWEHDLEFPNLDQMYKLSEIYRVPIEELMQVRTQTLEEGIKGIHKGIIRFLGYLLGFSIYGTIIISNILIYGTLIIVFLNFIAIANQTL